MSSLQQALAQLKIDDKEFNIPYDKINYMDWQIDLDRDDKLTETLLDLRDENGYPIKLQLGHMPETIEEIQQYLLSEESFNMIPECESFSYFVARSITGLPVKKCEVDEIKRSRRILKKRIDRADKLKKKIKKDSLKKVLKIEHRPTILEFD